MNDKADEPKSLVKINRKLNLVIPVISEKDGKTYNVHVTPISYEVYEQNFILFGKAASAMFTGGSGLLGPKQASLYLKKAATELDVYEDHVQAVLLPEMRRLANVIMPNGRGYEIVPWDDVLTKKFFDEEDIREVENVMTFFMLVWPAATKSELPLMLEMVTGLGAEFNTSLKPMAYANTLKTSITGAITDAKATEPEATSSFPS